MCLHYGIEGKSVFNVHYREELFLYNTVYTNTLCIFYTIGIHFVFTLQYSVAFCVKSTF